MKLIICGTRNLLAYKRVEEAMRYWMGIGMPRPSIILCGGATGPDANGAVWARRQSPQISVCMVTPNWERFGKGAGMIRNQKMLDMGADGVVAIWDGESRGTAHMISIASKKRLPVLVQLREEHFFHQFGEINQQLQQKRGEEDGKTGRLQDDNQPEDGDCGLGRAES